MKRLFYFSLLFSVLLLNFNCLNPKNQTEQKLGYYDKNVEENFPQQIGFVNDFSNIFTEQEKMELEKYLENYENETSNEIAIVTIEKISPYRNIMKYTSDLGNYWDIGQEGKDNGILIVMDMGDRKIRIGTGLGTEMLVSDIFLKNVIDKKMVPLFKENIYFEGMKAGLEAITKEWGTP